MEELVFLLKQAREEKNMLLEEISRHTKIQMRYLQALENNDFSPFAGEVYLKGALAAYASAVGLDGGEVLALYSRLKQAAIAANKSRPANSREARSPEQAREVTPATKRKQFKKQRQGPSLTTGVVVLVLLLVSAGVWFSQNYDWPRYDPEPDRQDNGLAENGDVDVEEPIPDPQPRPEITVVSATDGETVFAVSGVAEINMTLVFQGPCWVRLSVDGTAPIERTFTVGDNVSVTATETIRLRMGNPPVVRISVNDFSIEENLALRRPHNFLFNIN